MRHGRFQEALKYFSDLTMLDPSLPDGYFFISLSYFLHLIYHPEKKSYIDEFKKNLEQSISKGKKLLRSGQANDETFLFLGTSYLLESYYKAKQKEYIRSAFSAKKGKRILEKILRKNPELYDAYFGLGIFHYYADRVPSFIKGLRFFLFLPGGDREKALFQLSRSSLQSKYLDVESSLILAEIYSSKYERDYYAAYRELSMLSDHGEEYLLILHAIAKLEMKILNYFQASKILEQALAKGRRQGTDSDVLRLMQLHLAQCYFKTFRLDKAASLIESLIQQNPDMPESMTEITYILGTQVFSLLDKKDQWKKSIDPFSKKLSKYASSSGDVSYSQAELCNFHIYLEVSKAVDEGDFQKALMKLKEAHPPCRKDARWMLLEGETLLKFGKVPEALSLFMRLLHMRFECPASLRSIAELRAANCYDVMEERTIAQQYYQRLSMRSSPAREAAYFYLKKPFDLQNYFPQASTIPEETKVEPSDP